MKCLRLFKDKRETKYALIFGGIFSLVNLLAKEMQETLYIDFRHFMYILINSVLLTFVVAEISIRSKNFLLKTLENKNCKEYNFSKGDGKYFLITGLIILVAWIPVWLAYYPGLFAYDVMTQIPQAENGYSVALPLLHTLFLNFFYYTVGGEIFQNYSTGIAWCTVVQMVIFAFMLSYIHLFFKRCCINKKLRVILIAITSLFPVFPVLAISMTKDIFFAGFFGMLFTCLGYWELNAEKTKKSIEINIVYFISVAGTILFRANGVYAVAAMCVVVVLSLGKKSKKIIFLTLLSFVSSVLLLNGVKAGLSAEDSSKNDVLSILYQQLAYVYAVDYEELSDEDRADIELIIPRVTYYNPNNADPVKFTGTASDNMDCFVDLYFRLLKKYPLQYVQAFMHTNLGYFYIFDTTNANNVYGYGLDGRQGYLLTDTKYGFDVVHETKFKPLETLYENLFSANEYQKIFPLFVMCSLAVYFWTIVLMFFRMLELKNWRIVSSMTLVLVLGATSLLAPCALIRYIFPYILCIPTMIYNVYAKK
jgi:hypothetical protein